MKIAIIVLAIMLTIATVSTICLTINCNNQAQAIFKLNTDYNTLNEKLKASEKTNNVYAKEVKRLQEENKKFDELNNTPIQTVIREVVVNPNNIQKICLKEIV